MFGGGGGKGVKRALGTFWQPGPPCRDGISLDGHFELFLSGMFHLPIPRWTLVAPLFMGKAAHQLLASSLRGVPSGGLDLHVLFHFLEFWCSNPTSSIKQLLLTLWTFWQVGDYFLGPPVSPTL